MQKLSFIPWAALGFNQSVSLGEINECPTTFCGCQTIKYDIIPTSYSLMDQETSLQISPKLYIYTLLTLLIIMSSIKLSLQWFIYKDYFPFKERSPILSIIMAFSICTQVILYPLIYSVNYFTYMFNQPGIRYIFRGIQAGLQFTVYMVYLLRALRIVYAHQTHKTRRGGLAFWVWEREWVLALSVMIVAVLKAILVGIQGLYGGERVGGSKNFAFGFELAVFSSDGDEYFQNFYVVRNLISSFIWQLVLIYCVWIHKQVNYRYTMQTQLITVLLITQISNILNISVLFQTLNQYSILRYLCGISSLYPMTEFLKIINLLIILGISLIYPLTQKKVYHVLLPTGPHYGFTKTMRNFLMEKQFLRVFSAYLAYLDQQQRQNGNESKYVKLLKFWQQMVLFKMGGHSTSGLKQRGFWRTLFRKKQTQSEIQQRRFENIIRVLEQAESDILAQHSFLIQKLKQTITGLQDSQLEPSETSFVSTRSVLASQITQQTRMSISDKIDELEQISLQKLNKVYIDHYYFTKSYDYLRKIMNDYKRVNLNLIMLNMALIVDSNEGDGDETRFV